MIITETCVQKENIAKKLNCAIFIINKNKPKKILDLTTTEWLQKELNSFSVFVLESSQSKKLNDLINPYLISITTDNTPVYHSANKNSGIVKRLNRFSLITIIDEKNGFGKIKVGAGWIDLSKVEKLK